MKPEVNCRWKTSVIVKWIVLMLGYVARWRHLQLHHRRALKKTTEDEKKSRDFLSISMSRFGRTLSKHTLFGIFGLFGRQVRPACASVDIEEALGRFLRDCDICRIAISQRIQMQYTAAWPTHLFRRFLQAEKQLKNIIWNIYRKTNSVLTSKRLQKLLKINKIDVLGNWHGCKTVTRSSSVRNIRLVFQWYKTDVVGEI